jgi:GDP-4-dehydro-6-deoxy-D-mannose reductase
MRDMKNPPDTAPAPRALITGASGFVGGYLARALMDGGWELTGYDTPPRGAGNLTFYQGDLRDSSRLSEALRGSHPDVIFHFAGVIKSDNPASLYAANVLGTLAMFEALVKEELNPLVVLASSSAVYGRGTRGRPINERFKPRPLTHYAISKLAQELVGFNYHEKNGIPVVVVRTFNLIGPGQSPHLACSAFARQIALAEIRGGQTLVTGNLDSHRDFIDVRDAAQAYRAIAARGRPGQIYNVCSNEAVSIRTCLDMLLSMASVPIRPLLDERQIQNGDAVIQIGDSSRLRKLTGWKPQISLRQSLTDLLNYWRERIKSEME